MTDDTDIDQRRLRQRIGAQLRAARTQAGLTQQAAAARLGIAQPHISNHETGREQPGPDMLARYRAVYDA